MAVRRQGVRRHGDIAAYAMEVTRNFLTGRYATFSSEGAMLGYLLSGDSEKAFKNIELAIATQLVQHIAIREHPHRVSQHTRATQPHPASPVDFLCHHMLLAIRTTS